MLVSKRGIFTYGTYGMYGTYGTYGTVRMVCTVRTDVLKCAHDTVLYVRYVPYGTSTVRVVLYDVQYNTVHADLFQMCRTF